jgi:sorbitol-specific phosphotransferase system component IIC
MEVVQSMAGVLPMVVVLSVKRGALNGSVGQSRVGY